MILGGGFGGVAAAHHLRSLLHESDEIVLVDQQDEFMMGFRKNSIVAGHDGERRSLSGLRDLGIDVRIASIESIDPAAVAATVGGEPIAADAMIVALGADVVAAAIPGLAQYGINVYSAQGAERARDALANLVTGRIVVGIFGAPYKCPPAPFELALLLNHRASTQNTGWKITVFSPLPMSVPALGPAGCNPLETRLSSEGIDFVPNTKATSVEQGRVVVADGAPIPFELLLAVPPHRVPSICVDSGLAQESGWVKANPRTFETPFKGVYAVGDSVGVPLSNGTALPKAGAIAEAEAIVVASRIVDRLAGSEPTAEFNGKGECYMEVGGGQAMRVRGNFFEDPPRVELSSASPDALAERDAYEQSRLDQWFGAR
ncbi:MAG: hypothetical protein NVSMB57_17050 [Actinomycetota bacterium]